MNSINKFNWGHGITIFFSMFVMFMLYLVVKSNQQNIDLVSDDYYAQEIAYGERMQQIGNTTKLADSLQVIQQGIFIIIKFPEAIANVSGTATLYRPSDQQYDMQESIVLNAQNEQLLSVANLPKGFYKLKVSWQSDQKAYYFEHPVLLD